MKYDIHFSIAGMIIYVLLLFGLKIMYNSGQNSIKKLRDLIVCLLLADIFDIISAYTITYRDSVPLIINYFTNGAFFIMETVCMAMLPRYIRFVLDPEEGAYSIFDYINTGITVIFGVICATSGWTHLIFFFENNNYRRGPLNNLAYALGVYFLFYSFVRLVSEKSRFSRRQFYSILAFLILSVLGSIVQFLLPYSLFILYFVFSIAAFIIIFGLETPDYLKLQKTLGELEISQKHLEEAVERAEAADKAKSDFLANMSHEIRTPINAVLGMNELIARETTQSEVREYSENLSDAGQALLSLINDILDFSRIEAGRMELAETEYDLRVLLREVSHIMSLKFENKGLKFEIDNNPDVPYKLFGDDIRIRQILINLLNNALKYTDTGSVKLFVNFKENVGGAIDLILSVKDTGIGIKEEDLPKLFESFKRVDLENNRKREGTGLGLSITQSLVEMMDGHIEVQSTYGEGTDFTVYIKQKVTDTSPMGAFDRNAHSNLNRKKYTTLFTAPTAKILVVDDVKINITVFAGLLKQTGMTIDTATSGAECLELIKDNSYDVIFLDHMMPEMSGVETLERMKADSTHINQNTPVIMLTANAIVGAKEEYLNAGFEDYLAKPVQWMELENMLIKYLPEEKVVKNKAE